MRRLIFIVLLSFTIVAYSQNNKTLKDIKKEFKHQKEFALDVDLSHTSFSGLSYEDFIEYLAGKNNVSPLFMKAVINKYKASFYVTSKEYRFVEDKSNTIPYRIHIRVENINEQAGVAAKAFISYKDSVDFAYFDLSVKDGRWNSFDVLLSENAEKQRSYLLNTFRYYVVNDDMYIKRNYIRKIIYVK